MLKRLFGVILVGGILGACSSTGNFSLQNVDLQDVSNSIVIGETNKAKIIEVMGFPNKVDITENGLEVLRYEFKRTEPHFLNFTPVILFYGSSEVLVKQVVIILNNDKTIKDFVVNEAVLENRFGLID